MIKAEGLTKRFGDLTVLSDIDMSIRKGEIYGLIGYNGVGKTTLLKILAGIYRPDSGRAMIGGEPVYENPKMKEKCFFMTEEAGFFPQYSLNRMRNFYAGYYPGWCDNTFEELVKWFGVDPTAKISRFSKGMQRQASLILAFSTRPSYLFMDEAFDGLDYSMRRQVREMFSYYAKAEDAAILVTSHNLGELEEMSDRIGMLHEGRLIFDDSVEHMKEGSRACEFVFEGDIREAAGDTLDLLERTGVVDSERNVYRYYCLVEGDTRSAEEKLKSIGAFDIKTREIQLEEFFRKERKEREADWGEIFKSQAEADRP